MLTAMLGRGVVSQKFAFVQALRGIAALWVVLFHTNAGGHIPTLYNALPSAISGLLFDAGHLGVAIFFTLSGFVIAHSLSGKEMTPRYWGLFMLRRSVRLDPAFWASMVLVTALGAISAAVNGELFVLPTFGNVAAHVAYLQVILHQPEISPVYWTLTYEFQFYAIFAAAMMFRCYIWALLLLALLSAIGIFDGLMPGLFVDLWASFFIGVLTKHAVADPRWLAGLAVVGVPLAWSGEFGLTNVVTAILLWVTVYSGWADRGLNVRGLQFLGAISYSLYLIHNPISGAAGFIAHRVLGVGLLADTAAAVAILTASISAAALLWIFVERPTQILSKRIQRKRVNAPNPLATLR